jgi:RNA polymerase sigma-70 factor (ECF subfamily)
MPEKTMTTANGQSAEIQRWLDRLRAGDDSARAQLLACARQQLERLTHKMLRGWDRVHRWEQTPDVMQNALVRLYRALSECRPATAAEFFRLAATSIRRELQDLAKHYYGPHGAGANHATPNWRARGDQAGEAAAWEFGQVDEDPAELAIWTEFHAGVALLPDAERAAFDLLWYEELPQAEAARLLGISERTLKRHWAAARLRLGRILGASAACVAHVTDVADAAGAAANNASLPLAPPVL